MQSTLKRMNKKFGCYDHRHEKTGGSIEKPQPRLFADVCQMTEIPRYEIINFVKRSQRDVQRVGDKFSMKNAA